MQLTHIKNFLNDARHLILSCQLHCFNFYKIKIKIFDCVNLFNTWFKLTKMVTGLNENNLCGNVVTRSCTHACSRHNDIITEGLHIYKTYKSLNLMSIKIRFCQYI